MPDRKPRFDGWANSLTGYGTNRDKRMASYFEIAPVTIQEAESLWQGDDLAARVIETMPSEMLREGFELVITEDAAPSSKTDPKDRRGALRVVAEADDPIAERKPGDALARAKARRDAAKQAQMAKPSHEVVDEVMQAWEDLGLVDALWHGLAYEAAYGGGAILIGANDGQRDMRAPLNEDRIIAMTYLLALEPREIIPVKWYADPLAPKFGQPEIYLLNPQGTGLPSTSAKGAVALVEVHESRLAIFPGIRTSRIMRTSVTYGWGDNKLTRFVPTLRDFNGAMSAAGVLLSDFAQGVFKVQNLVETMTSENSADWIARLQTIDASRSALRAILIDAENESFERVNTPVSGMAELLDRFMTRLASAADMPLTLLMGQSPGGLNATGASDIRFFYDRVASMQRRKLAPVIRKITRIILRALKCEPSKWTINFAPLWQPTEKEQAEARNVQMQTDKGYVEIGSLTPDEVTRARFGGPRYSFETHVDFDERAEYDIPGDAPADIRDPGAPLGPDADVNPAAAAAVPAGGGAKALASAGVPVQSAAMNGAQISSMIEVCTSYFEDRIPRAAAIAILTVGFPITKEQAEAMLPENFEAAPPPPSANPFGGGPPGGGAPFGGKPKPEDKAPPAGKPEAKAESKAESKDEPYALDGQLDPDEDSVDDDEVTDHADYSPDQPRAEDGKFGEGGGGSGGEGGGASGGGGDKAGADGGGGAASLTKAERTMLTMFAKSGMSDKKVLAALGVSRDEAMRIGNSIRDKLKLGPGGSLKEAGRRLAKGQ